jgi:hypothetical protein
MTDQRLWINITSTGIGTGLLGITAGLLADLDGLMSFALGWAAGSVILLIGHWPVSALARRLRHKPTLSHYEQERA